MTVKISKDKINVREKLSELDKPSGIAGEAMLRADTPAEQFELINAGRRNLIINGGFDVWQRGTTFTNIPTTTYSVDRWRTYTANGAVTITKENDEFYNYAKWDITTLATTDTVQPQQSIERGITPSTTYAVSFLAKGNGSVKDVEFRQTGATPVIEYNSRPLSSEWQKHTFVVTTASDFNKDAPMSVILHLNQETSVFEMTQFQLEFGSVATPFEYRSYGEELALCQRYFYATPIMGAGVYNLDTQFFCTPNPPVTFRTTPTITTKSGVLTNINIESSDLYDISSMAISHNPNGRNPLVSFGFPARSNAFSGTGYGGIVAMDQNGDEFFFDAEI